MDRDQPPHVQQWQDKLNEAWPVEPLGFRSRPGIPVTVRIVCQRDGEEWINGVAKRRDSEQVWVPGAGRCGRR
jgi:hypothetical protein